MALLTKRKTKKTIKKADLELIKALQTNKINLIFGIQDKETAEALNFAALDPEASDKVKEFLIATRNALNKLGDYIKEQKNIAPLDKLFKIFQTEEALVENAIILLEQAIPTNASLDIKSFNKITQSLQQSFLNTKKYIDKL